MSYKLSTHRNRAKNQPKVLKAERVWTFNAVHKLLRVILNIALYFNFVVFGKFIYTNFLHADRSELLLLGLLHITKAFYVFSICFVYVS